MPCGESLRLHALFDDELGAPDQAAMERHISGCAECSAQWGKFVDLRRRARTSLPFEVAPPLLRSRIERALDAEYADQANKISPAMRKIWQLSSFWFGAVSGMGAALLAAVFAFFFVSARLTSPLFDEMVAAHIQSLLPGQLIAVESTDRHTVKPWFAGRSDVSPVVADFAAQGYRLLGGRVDTIAQQRAAVVVYQHGRHVVNVFSWVAKQPISLTDTTRNGYHIACWRTSNLENCAMSDIGGDELMGLEVLLRNLGDRDSLAR